MAMAPRLMRSPATRQYLLGQGLQQQGLQTSPIYSNTEGFARLAQALAGGLLQRDAQQKYEAQQAKDTAQLASLLGGAGVAPQLASLFASDVPGASNAAATLMAGQQAQELARIQAGGKAKRARIIDGDSPEGQALGLPSGQSAPVTFNANNEPIEIGKTFDTKNKTFGGTSTTSAALQTLASAPEDSKEYALAHAFLSRPQVITRPDGTTTTMSPVDLSAVAAPTFGNRNQQPEAAAPQPEPVATSDGEPSPPPLSEEKVEASPEGVPVSDVTVAADKEYAKTRLPEFREEEAKAIGNLQKLNEVVTALGNRDDLTGITPAVALKLGEIIGLPGAFAGTAADVQNRILSVAQESIKAIMGAAFAEKEGENVLRRAYDVSQPEAVNMKRVRELIGALEVVQNAKRKEAEYFEKHGTLRGYVGPSRQELEGIVRGRTGAEAAKPMQKGETRVINGVTIERTN